MKKNNEDILGDGPEYEAYSENEATLTLEEMKELGIKPEKKSYILGGGCNCNKGCCKNR